MAMVENGISEATLKRMLKEALVEALDERRDLLREILEEVLEDFELVEDVREVKKPDQLRRVMSFGVREGEA